MFKTQMTNNKLQKNHKSGKLFPLFIICCLLFVISAPAVKAASSAALYFTSAKVDYVVGENIPIKLRVNPNSEQINVVRARFHFNTNVASMVSSSLDGAWPYQSPGSSLDIPSGVANLGGFILSSVITVDSQFMTFSFVGTQVGDLTFTFDANNLLIDPSMTNQIDNSLLRSYTVHIGAGTPPPPPPVDCSVTNTCPPPPPPPVDCHVTNTCPPPPPPPGPVNHAPVIDNLGEKLGYIAQEVKFTVTATDPDNDLIILSTDDAPVGSVFNPSTGVFSWIPSAQGIYYVTFRATDNSPLGPLSSTKTVRLTIFCSENGSNTGGGSALTCPTGGEGGVLVCPICQQEPTPTPFKACTISSGSQLRSISHPNQDAWYSSNFVSLKWNQDPRALGYKIAMTKNPDLGPKEVISQILDTQMSYKDLPDGIWYFHLVTQYEGDCSPDNNFRIKVDTKSPELEITDVTLIGEGATFYFSGRDLTSGVHRYEYRIDGDPWQVTTSPLTIKKLNGEKRLSLRVDDFAGNVTEVQFSLDDFKQVGDVSEYTIFVTPEKTVLTPVIDQLVTRKIVGLPAPTDLLIFTGSGEPLSSVTLYLMGDGQVKVGTVDQSGKETLSATTEVDSTGKWKVFYDKYLVKGGYTAYAIATKEGKESPSSNEVRLQLGEDKYSVQVFPWPVLLMGVALGILLVLLIRMFITDVTQRRKK